MNSVFPSLVYHNSHFRIYAFFRTLERACRHRHINNVYSYCLNRHALRGISLAVATAEAISNHDSRVARIGFELEFSVSLSPVEVLASAYQVPAHSSADCHVSVLNLQLKLHADFLPEFFAPRASLPSTYS